MTDQPTIVDAHQHFWDQRELRLFCPPPQHAILNKPYLPSDLAPELHECGIQYTVLVQGYPQSNDGNRWLLARATESPFVAGVVAWGSLTNPDRFAKQLDEFASEPKFCGIRHIVEDEPNERFLIQDSVLESLGELERRSIPFDFLVKPRHLPSVIDALEKLPNLRAVIDHIGKPDIANGEADQWIEYMEIIAQHPFAFCKLSGMVTEADWTNWQTSDFPFYVDRILEWFGANRVMYGSDWPVCLLAADYGRIWRLANELLEDLDEDDRANVLGKNAIEFYLLNVPVQSLHQH
jgi:L-fuconolactonase